MLFEANNRGEALWPMPAYFAARLMTQEWTQPGDRRHKLYPISSDTQDRGGRPVVSAYAVQRPDGKWSIMLVNKDQRHDHLVNISFTDGKSFWHFADKVATYQYSSKQYSWKASGENGHPLRTQPPRHFRQRGDQLVRLPAFSLSVIRGKFPTRLRKARSLPRRDGHAHPRPLRRRVRPPDRMDPGRNSGLRITSAHRLEHLEKRSS